MVFSLTIEDARKKWYSALTTEEKVSWLSLASYEGVVFILYHREQSIGFFQPTRNRLYPAFATKQRVSGLHSNQNGEGTYTSAVSLSQPDWWGEEGRGVTTNNLQEVEWKDEIIIPD